MLELEELDELELDEELEELVELAASNAKLQVVALPIFTHNPREPALVSVFLKRHPTAYPVAPAFGTEVPSHNVR